MTIYTSLILSYNTLLTELSKLFGRCLFWWNIPFLCIFLYGMPYDLRNYSHWVHQKVAGTVCCRAGWGNTQFTIHQALLHLAYCKIVSYALGWPWSYNKTTKTKLISVMHKTSKGEPQTTATFPGIRQRSGVTHAIYHWRAIKWSGVIVNKFITMFYLIYFVIRFLHTCSFIMCSNIILCPCHMKTKIHGNKAMWHFY